MTDSELAVVRLVASGLTNKEAAERLYISPHTVSGHLRHAFDKLGINSASPSPGSPRSTPARACPAASGGPAGPPRPAYARSGAAHRRRVIYLIASVLPRGHWLTCR